MSQEQQPTWNGRGSLRVPDGPFQATWESLSQYQVPQWYVNGKFGIFIHWGLYSVPAFGNEWYPRNMYLTGTPEYEHHLKTYGPHTQFGYKDFLPMLTAERFDPESWAELFRKAGARFVVPVAEHHDGFAMYKSDLTDWCAAKMGPKRDLIGELAEAVRREWLVFGLSSHRAEHWWFFDGGRQFASDAQDKRYAGLYGPAQKRDTQPNEEFLDDWLARTCELVDRYRPQLLWFDWWIQEPAFVPYLKRLAAYYYNAAVRWGRGVAINYKHHAFPDEAAVYDVERGQLADIRRLFWQCDTSISKTSWGFIQGHEYKSASAIIGDLADIVSKNGALLLNIGPKPDGTIPPEEERVLLDIGGWLAVNDGELSDRLRNMAVIYEGLHTYGGMSGRDMEALAIGISEAVQDDHIRSRVGQVLYLGELLVSWNIPIVQPVGGHAVFLDAKAFYPHIPQDQFPAQTLAAQLYADSGVRGMERGIVSAGRDPDTGAHRYPALELTRLAIPRRVYTQAHMDVVAEAVKAAYENRADARGLDMVYEPEYLRFFQARFKPVTDND